MKNKYTSLKLSMALHDAGFKKESEYQVYYKHNIRSGFVKMSEQETIMPVFGIFPCFDILNDLCLKYTKEVWGWDDVDVVVDDETLYREGDAYQDCAYVARPIHVMTLLRDGKKQEAEDFIFKYSILFNKQL